MAFFITEDNGHTRLKSYDATIKGKTATLKVTFEVTDTFELSFLLRQLEDLTATQEARRRKPEPSARRAPPAGRKTLTSQSVLALPPPRIDRDDL